MYVYVQGRRLQRRVLHSAAPARQLTPRTEALDELISQSLELCENTERKLETVAGNLEARAEWDCNPARRPSASPRVNDPLFRPWTGRSRAVPVSSQRDGSEKIKSDELVRILEEREMALLKRTEYLEHRATWLASQLSDARNEKRLLENKMKQLEAASRLNAVAEAKKIAAVRRRYHFAIAGDALDTSLTDLVRDTGYFEVKFSKFGPREESAGERIDRTVRFAYSDRPCDAFSVDGAVNAPNLLDPAVVCVLALYGQVRACK